MLTSEVEKRVDGNGCGVDISFLRYCFEIAYRLCLFILRRQQRIHHNFRDKKYVCIIRCRSFVLIHPDPTLRRRRIGQEPKPKNCL